MGASEGFKDYAQKWRDLAGRVQPLLSDRELVDMFLGMLSGPFFNHLIGSSSAGFTELILTGERVEVGIRSGKIQPYTTNRNMWVHFFQDSLSGTQLNGPTSWREPMSETGKILLLLSTSSINTTPILLLLVLNPRVCPWVQVKVLKIIRKNGETWLGEFNPRCLIGSWLICSWGAIWSIFHSFDRQLISWFH